MIGTKSTKNAAMLRIQLSSSIGVVTSAPVLLGEGRKDTSFCRCRIITLYSLRNTQDCGVAVAVAVAIAVDAT